MPGNIKDIFDMFREKRFGYTQVCGLKPVTEKKQNIPVSILPLSSVSRRIILKLKRVKINVASR